MEGINYEISQSKLFVNNKQIDFKYDISYLTQEEPAVFEIENKLLVVLNYAKKDGLFLHRAEESLIGDVDRARNAYCLDQQGAILWRGEAYRMVNTYISFCRWKDKIYAQFDHNQSCEINMETGELIRGLQDPPAPED